MRERRIILVTGADEAFAGFLRDALSSLADSGVLEDVELGILDQGLSRETLAEAERYNARIVRPTWPDFVPVALRRPAQIGLVVRPLLRDLFPGRDVYIWFDADAWVQDKSFLPRYLDGALNEGAAVALENGINYRQPFAVKKWWLGNHIASFGPWHGARLALRRSINIGILAMSSQAPHWEAWTKYYRATIEKTGKLNLDQHAFHAAIHLDRLPTRFLDATDNWLPILSTPAWDGASGKLCEPGAERRPLSIVHLAGPDKARPYFLDGYDGQGTALSYRALGSDPKSA